MTTLVDSAFCIAWLLTVFWLVRAAVRTACRLFPGSQGASRVLHVSVLAIAYCLLGLTVVGALGLIASWTVLIGIVLTASAADRFVRPRPAEAEPSSVVPFGPKLMWTAAASLLAGHVIRNGFHRWPSDWDTLMYHLPFMDHWIQTGSLTATESARWSMPAASELLGLAFVAPFSGDFLVALNNVPTIIVLTAAIIELGRIMGMSGWWPHLMALSCLLVQTTVRQSVDASNDLMVGAFFIAGIVYLLRYSTDQRNSDAVLFGICLGILGSVKYLAIGYAFLLIVIYGLISISTRPQKALRSFRIVAIPAMLCGGYWYARNWVMTGYPLYPVGASELIERLPYPGLHNTMLAFHLTPLTSDLVVDAIMRLCGPVQLAALAALPTLFAWLGYRTIASQGAQRAKYAIFLLSLLGSFLILLVTPMLVEDQPGTMNHLRWGYTTVRYGLCFLSCAAIALFMAASQLAQAMPPKRQNVLLAGAGLLTFWQFVYCLMHIDRFEVEQALIIACCIAMTAVIVGECRSFGTIATACISAVIGLAIVIETANLSQRWHSGLAKHFDRYHNTRVFSELSQRPVRMLVLDERSYPYFGSKRENYIQQPMLFYSIGDVTARMNAADLEVVATCIETEKIIARYRPAWDELKSDPKFIERFPHAPGRVLMFRKTSP